LGAVAPTLGARVAGGRILSVGAGCLRPAGVVVETEDRRVEIRGTDQLVVIGVYVTPLVMGKR
jgi:hypothetical protein